MGATAIFQTVCWKKAENPWCATNGLLDARCNLGFSVFITMLCFPWDILSDIPNNRKSVHFPSFRRNLRILLWVLQSSNGFLGSTGGWQKMVRGWIAIGVISRSRGRMNVLNRTISRIYWRTMYSTGDPSAEKKSPYDNRCRMLSKSHFAFRGFIRSRFSP